MFMSMIKVSLSKSSSLQKISKNAPPELKTEKEACDGFISYDDIGLQVEEGSDFVIIDLEPLKIHHFELENLNDQSSSKTNETSYLNSLKGISIQNSLNSAVCSAESYIPRQWPKFSNPFQGISFSCPISCQNIFGAPVAKPKSPSSSQFISRNISQKTKNKLNFYYKNKPFSEDKSFVLIKKIFVSKRHRHNLLKAINTIQQLIYGGGIYLRVVDAIKRKLYRMAEETDLLASLSVAETQKVQTNVSIFVNKVVHLSRYTPSYFPTDMKTDSIKNLLKFFEFHCDQVEFYDVFLGCAEINNENPISKAQENFIELFDDALHSWTCPWKN